MANPQTDSRGQIQRRDVDTDQARTLIALVERMGSQIEKALPKHITADRMARMAMTAIRSTRDLARCDAMSFAGCLMQCAQLGLEPNTPLAEAYLIPRFMKVPGTRNHDDKMWQCTLIIGYQGMMKLSRNSGLVTSFRARPVFEGDDFAFEYGSHETLHHIPKGDENPDKVTHAYARAFLKDCPEPEIEVLTRKAIEIARARGGSDKGERGGFSPWRTDYPAMAAKTAIRRLWKQLPKSAEIARAIIVDESGDRQAALFSPEVHDVLHSQGFEVPSTESTIDPETGEVIEQPKDVQ